MVVGFGAFGQLRLRLKGVPVVLSALQPGYLPWLGFFEQTDRADTFLICDQLNYERYSWRNRNRVKTGAGPVWLTVPVQGGGDLHSPISEIRIAGEQRWQRRHRETLKRAYARARYFDQHRDFFEHVYSRQWERLAELDIEIIEYLVDALEISTPVLLQSRLRLEQDFQAAGGGDATDRLIFFCRTLGADSFYNGAAGRGYMDQARIAAAGIELIFQDYRHPVYAQLHGEFVPYLSVVDLLFNCGPASLRTLRAGAGSSTSGLLAGQ